MSLELAFRHRSSLVLILVVPLATWTLTASPTPAPHVGLGLALLAAGAALRLWAARCLGKGARVHRARARDGVVDWGPYAWSRNPLYVAAGLIFAGLASLAGGGWWALCLLPATFLVYTPVVAHEEAAIRASEGSAFSAYFGRVSRWLGVPRRSAATSGSRYPWRKVLKREAGLLPGLTIAALGITLIQREVVPLRRLTDWATGQHPLGVLLACTLALGAGAAINSALIERKWRRKLAFRTAQSASAQEG